MWSTVDIAGKPAQVFQTTQPRFGLLFLHPVGQETLRDNAVYTRLLEEHRFACICPHGDYSWWADRVWQGFDPAISAESYVVQRVVPAFRELWQLAPPCIGLFGISMGGQGALRIAFKQAQLFPAVAGIASALDYYELHGRGLSLDTMYDSKEQCRQDGALLHINPGRFPAHIYFCADPDDEWHRGNDRLHEKLAALGVPHTCDLTTRSGGHSWQYFEHMAAPVLQFLVAGLEKESRRLL